MTSENPYSLSDEQLASHPTVLAPNLFDNLVVVVSGGGSGIGRATAWLAARLGAQVIICGRDPEKLGRTSDGIVGRGFRCEVFTFDIRERAGVDALFDNIFRRHQRVDLLVNSAGGQFPQAAIDFSEKGWKAVIDTNLTGTFNMMQRVARGWRDTRAPGSIINIVVSPRGLHQVAHTLAARAGVVAFSEAVAVEWAPLGIRVNCIAPGAITSEGWAMYAEHVRARYPETSPMRRAGNPWDVAEASLFVGGPGGRFITGETIHVNGGGNLWGEIWTAGKPPWFVEATDKWQQ